MQRHIGRAQYKQTLSHACQEEEVRIVTCTCTAETPSVLQAKSRSSNEALLCGVRAQSWWTAAFNIATNSEVAWLMM